MRQAGAPQLLAAPATGSQAWQTASWEHRIPGIQMTRPFARSARAVAALALLAACSGSEADGVQAAIDAALESVIADGSVVGATVAVLHGDAVVHVRGYGLADRERQRPVDRRTPFNLGSVTKIFTGIALVTLAERGALSLDDPLGKWIPEFPNPQQAAAITLRQLVNHTSGLSDHLAADLERVEADSATMALHGVLSYLRNRPLDFRPGAHWSYSNAGFYLAGVIIERASGKPWETYLAEQVFAPLNLPGIDVCDKLRAEAPVGYTHSDSGLVPSDVYLVPGLRGDGGLCATAEDLALALARTASGTVLSAQGLEILTAATALTTGAHADYGLGVRRGELQGHRLWGHTGGHAGTVAAVAYFPDDSISIAVMINTTHSSHNALVLLGDVAVPVFGLDTTPPPAVELTAAELTRYAGRYLGGREGGHFDMRADSGRLWIRWSTRESASAYVQIGQHRFVRENASYPLDRYVFQEVNGEIVALSDYYNGLFEYFRQRERVVVGR